MTEISRRGLVGGLGAAALLAYDVRPAAASTYTRDIAVIGGGVGGVAAALAALRKGRRVIMTEETGMLGGQLTSQLVPPDEHYWIEPSAGGHGQSASYADLRRRVRESYKRHRPVTAAFRQQNEPNPGNAWVSRIAAEPMVWRNRIHDLLGPYVASRQLRLIYDATPVSAYVTGDTVRSVTVRESNGRRHTIAAKYFIDATELGDVLPVVGANYTIGREAGTGEPHNTAAVPNPRDQQAITWVAAVGYDPGGDYRTAAPVGYAGRKASFDTFFAQNLFDPTREYSWDEGPNFWQYRRVIARRNFTVAIEEVTLLNYPCNDYKDGPILGVSDAERAKHLAGAKNLTACLLHYLRNDIPRADGTGHGYRGLRLRPDIAGTKDGYAAHPYIREARRLVSIGRVWEWHVGVDARDGRTTAATFTDSVGAGHYWLDIHGGPVEPHGLWLRCYPYQVPFMALLPNNRRNLLAGGKCLGVSHVANGAYRLHPTEWTVGEAAGVAAHLALEWRLTPRQIRSRRMTDLKRKLRRQGAQTSWPTDLRERWQA